MSEVGSEELTAWAVRWATVASSGEEVDLFVQLVDDAILRSNSVLADDPILVEELHGSTRFHWLSFFAMLNQPAHRLALPVQAETFARSIARRGHDLDVLLKVYRSAHTGVFEYFSRAVDALGEDDPPRDDVLKFVWRRADQWIDESIEQLIKVYYDERQSLHDGALARRTATIDALLNGTVMPVDDATEALGHPMLHWQTAVVIWAGEAEPTGAQHLPALAAEAARRLDGTALTQVVGSRDLWCWIATPARPDLDALRELGPLMAERGARLAVGLPERGVSGFCDSHAEAVATQRLCLAAVRPEPIMFYRDVELLCLAGESPELLARMVEREVGALADADKNLAQVRETALAYLSLRMNAEATAKELFVHKNTVRYRLQKAEELLGHPLTERVTQVEVGLRYLALFGTPAPRGS